MFLTDLIGKGATRECYAHPEEKEKCIKVYQNPKLAEPAFKRELEIYHRVSPILGNFVCAYDPQLVDTNKGKGLVSELVLDDNGKTSRPLVTYLVSSWMNEQIIAEINAFTALLLKNNLFFYDFNLMNFVVQNKKGHFRLRYIDMKSFENYKSWSFLGLEKISPAIARHIMIRRLKRMYKLLNLPFPQ